MKSTLESLPNELFLIIFGYLSSLDRCRSFFGIKNARIESLLYSIRHSLHVSSMHYTQLHEFLSDENNNATDHFTSLIDTVVLRNSTACMMLYKYWTNRLNDPESLNVWLPSIKQLLILNAHHYFLMVRFLLKPLLFCGDTLQHLHLVFKKPSDDYSKILSDLVLHRISVHTMILEVEKGMLKKKFLNKIKTM